jgi:hypothetical protein
VPEGGPPVPSCWKRGRRRRKKNMMMMMMVVVVVVVRTQNACRAHLPEDGLRWRAILTQD